MADAVDELAVDVEGEVHGGTGQIEPGRDHPIEVGESVIEGSETGGIFVDVEADAQGTFANIATRRGIVVVAPAAEYTGHDSGGAGLFLSGRNDLSGRKLAVRLKHIDQVIWKRFVSKRLSYDIVTDYIGERHCYRDR